MTKEQLDRIEYIKSVTNVNEKLRLIIETGDIKFTKQCIYDETLGLETWDKVKLIQATKDIEFMKQCVYDKTLGLEKLDKVILIETTRDVEFIKQCIYDKRLKLPPHDIAELIIATNDIGFIKQCVYDSSLKLRKFDTQQLIEATKDIAFIKQCIYDPKLKLAKHQIQELIEATNDQEFIKKCIYDKKLKLSPKFRTYLIEIIRDEEFIKQCIYDKKIEIRRSDRLELIEATGDNDFKKQCMQDEELQLNSWEKIYLIKSIGNQKYTEECMHNMEWSENEKQVLSFIYDNAQFEERIDSKVQTKIDLPPEMTIGVEIESEGPNAYVIDMLGKIKDWKTKGDGSLKNGVEVVSPILTGNEEDSRDIYTICEILSKMGQKVSNRCGGHIHIGAKYLTSQEAYSNLLSIWGNAEEVIYKISNDAKETTRTGAVTEYAMPISKKIQEAIEKGTLNLDGEAELDSFIEDLKTVQEDRYSGINFQNIGEKERNTIEFRLPNGTIDPKVWIENINLFGGIIRAAEELAQINQKPANIQSGEEKRKVEVFSQLCSGELTEKETLNALLELTVREEQREIYERRYKINSKLFIINPIIQASMKKKIARKPIKPKEIGKKVFTGEPITGIEMDKAAERLHYDMEREKTEERINT